MFYIFAYDIESTPLLYGQPSLCVTASSFWPFLKTHEVQWHIGLKFILRNSGEFMYFCQTTMCTMVGRITNQFAEREKVSHKCGAEPMEQNVTVVSCLLDKPP